MNYATFVYIPEAHETRQSQLESGEIQDYGANERLRDLLGDEIFEKNWRYLKDILRKEGFMESLATTGGNNVSHWEKLEKVFLLAILTRDKPSTVIQDLLLSINGNKPKNKTPEISDPYFSSRKGSRTSFLTTFTNLNPNEVKSLTDRFDFIGTTALELAPDFFKPLIDCILELRRQESEFFTTCLAYNPQ